MKKILITGANSYIGTSFETWMSNYDGYQVDTLDMIDGSWREYDFSPYDAVLHVAGIAHRSTKNFTPEDTEKYYNVNTHLVIETAKKAKEADVKQFVFLSSMSVFGNKNECITLDTKPEPNNIYGDSKLKADIGVHALEDASFKVASIRPPMIYGKNSKGNYSTLAKFAKTFPLFPRYNNKRSMLYIENLCEFIKLIIDNEESGYFYPQNEDYVNTSDMVYQTALANGRTILLTKLFNPVLWLLRNHSIIKKVFGNLYYVQEMSNYKDVYNHVSFEESIRRTNK